MRKKQGRWPKNEDARTLMRMELAAAAERKQAMIRRDGSAGPASKCRRIDPESAEGKAILATLKPRA